MQELNMKDSLDANLVQMSTNYCLVYVAFSTALFYRLSTNFLPMYIPFSVVEKNKQWMFKNICNSFLHSFISSVWIAFCLWNYPAHRYDLINVYSNQSYLLICFSVGYFLYDFLDMYWNDRDSSLHLLVHHVVVMGVFGVALYSRFYLGYAMVGLLVEVNSVFLHLRTLMRLSARAADYPRLYWGVCILNLGTFIVFRLYLLAYLTLWLLRNRAFLNPSLFLFTLPCLVTINAMSWLLFAKIVVEDFAPRLIVAARLLGWNRLVRHLEEHVARAERRTSEDQCKGELSHCLEKDPYCTKAGNMIYSEEELCFAKRNNRQLKDESLLKETEEDLPLLNNEDNVSFNKGDIKSFKEDSTLINGDKGVSFVIRGSDHTTGKAKSPLEESSVEEMLKRGKNLAPSERESKRERLSRESDMSEKSDGEKTTESIVDRVNINHSDRDNEKDLNLKSADINSDLKNDINNIDSKEGDKNSILDLMSEGLGRQSNGGSKEIDSEGNCDRLQLVNGSELTKGTGETNLSHRMSMGESLPRTSCSEFFETEDSKRVCQGKVKAS